MGDDLLKITRRGYEDPTIWTQTLGEVQPHAPEHLQGGNDPIDLATKNAAGLMSSGDKTKLDRLSDIPGVSSHDELENVSAYQHHGHAAQEVKTWNGSDTTWTLAHIPTNGVDLYWKPNGGSYLLMDPEADYTLVGAVITPTNTPSNLDKTRVASYEYAGNNS